MHRTNKNISHQHCFMGSPSQFCFAQRNLFYPPTEDICIYVYLQISRYLVFLFQKIGTFLCDLYLHEQIYFNLFSTLAINNSIPYNKLGGKSNISLQCLYPTLISPFSPIQLCSSWYFPHQFFFDRSTGFRPMPVMLHFGWAKQRSRLHRRPGRAQWRRTLPLVRLRSFPETGLLEPNLRGLPRPTHSLAKQ